MLEQVKSVVSPLPGVQPDQSNYTSCLLVPVNFCPLDG